MNYWEFYWFNAANPSPRNACGICCSPTATLRKPPAICESLHALFDVLDPNRPHNHPARWVTRDEESYRLPWSKELSLDWRDYERFLEMGSPTPSANADDLARQLGTGSAAGSRELLSDFSSFDWSLSLREGWRTSYLVTATRLAQHYLEGKRTDKSWLWLTRFWKKERCWEAGYGLLDEAHIQDGRSTQATRVYDLCSGILRQELGVEPSDETEELFATALRELSFLPRLIEQLRQFKIDLCFEFSPLYVDSGERLPLPDPPPSTPQPPARGSIFT